MKLLSKVTKKIIKHFTPQKDNPAVVEEPTSVSDILSFVFGKDNTIENMRNTDVPKNDKYNVYVWKQADIFARNWLRDAGYSLKNTEIFDDSIGYSCVRKGEEYAIFFYAFGNERTVMLDGEYCSKLKEHKISIDKMVVICYVKVDKKTNDKGEKEYQVGAYFDSSSQIQPWLLSKIKGKDAFLYCLRKEMVDLSPRFIAGFNNSDLDILKSIFADHVILETYDSQKKYTKDEFYGYLSEMKEKHGKMKLCYVRFNDVVYSDTPYIDDYCYLNFSVNYKDKIDYVSINPLDNTYKEIIVCDDIIESDGTDKVPRIVSAEFMKPTALSRFSIRLVFDNGEIRQYDFPGNFSADEVIKYNGFTFTDEIFANGKLQDNIPLPIGAEYLNYSKRGQGINFFNGFCLSAIELYCDSYPIEKFNYSKLANVHVAQFDYQDDGFGVGYIHNLDPKNPYYLFDKNTMTATEIPMEYNDTPIGIWPFYGGYSEGLIMVSSMNNFSLQYHHNFRTCAGMWGWLDREMNVVIEPQFIYALNFTEGKAIVCRGTWEKNEKEQYWCENEQWGVINTKGEELVPCKFDELYRIDETERLFFVHEGGWENGHYAIFDSAEQKIVLELDFDFDMGYMFNECFLTDKNILVFMDHQPGEEKDFVYAYDLTNKKYLAYKQEYRERTYNGQTKVVVTAKNGEEITVF